MNPDSEDLYERLGVGRQATGEEIKRAWRAAVKACHPDRNGKSNPEDIKRINQAWHILKDDERRRRYDRDGVAEPASYDFRANVMSLLAQLFTEAVKRGVPKINASQYKGYRHRYCQDLVGEVGRHLKQALEENKNQRRSLSLSQRYLQGVAKRLRKEGGGPDFLAHTVAQELEVCQRSLLVNHSHAKTLIQARKLLKSYRFDTDSTDSHVTKTMTFGGISSTFEDISFTYR